MNRHFRFVIVRLALVCVVAFACCDLRAGDDLRTDHAVQVPPGVTPTQAIDTLISAGWQQAGYGAAPTL